jgi:hypothetical protein
MRYDLGFFDHETCRIESADNPFAAKLLPMSPAAGITATHLFGMDKIGLVAGAGFEPATFGL